MAIQTLTGAKRRRTELKREADRLLALAEQTDQLSEEDMRRLRDELLILTTALTHLTQDVDRIEATDAS